MRSCGVRIASASAPRATDITESHASCGIQRGALSQILEIRLVAQYIGLRVRFGLLHGFDVAHLSGLAENVVGGRDRFFQTGEFADVGWQHHQGIGSRQVLEATGGQVVDHRDAGAQFQQASGQIAADETATACHQTGTPGKRAVGCSFAWSQWADADDGYEISQGGYDSTRLQFPKHSVAAFCMSIDRLSQKAVVVYAILKTSEPASCTSNTIRRALVGREAHPTNRSSRRRLPGWSRSYRMTRRSRGTGWRPGTHPD